MPSSPELTQSPELVRSPELVQRFELAELAELRTGSVPPPAAAVTFVADAVRSGAPAAVFEIAQRAGIPDELLAPARAAAQAAGYAAGWASGIRAARLVADAEAHVAAAERDRAGATQRAALAQAITAIDRAAGALEQRAVPAAEQIEQLILSSAFAIAETLVGRTLADEQLRSNAAVARALSLAPTDEDVVVTVHPADLAALGAAGTARTEGGRTIAFAADGTLAPGDAVARSGATSIDARLGAALERIREVLAP